VMLNAPAAGFVSVARAAGRGGGSQECRKTPGMA
jgi:hypothetical protein